MVDAASRISHPERRYGSLHSSSEEGLRLAEENSIKGKDVTPFVLAHVAKSTSNSSLQANLALVENNARVGAEIAKAYGA